MSNEKETDENTSLICRNALWDIGEIDTTEGLFLQHEFLLENLSSENVFIDKIDSTCGCLVTDDFDKIVQPGCSTNIKCTITLPPFPGQIQKFLFIQGRGEKPVRLQLAITAVASLNPMLHTFPEKVDFGIIKPGEKQFREVTIKRYDGTPVLYQEVVNLAELPGISVIEKSSDGKSVTLELTLDTSDQSLGAYRTSVKISTEHEKYSTLELPLQASIQDEDLEFVPLIFIDRLNNGESKFSSIWRQGAEKKDISIKNVIFDGDSALDVKLIKSDKTGNETVSITRKMDLTVARIAKGNLKIAYQKKGGSEKDTIINVTAFLPAN